MAYLKRRVISAQAFSENTVLRIDIPRTEAIEGLVLEFSGLVDITTGGTLQTKEGMTDIVRHINVSALCPTRPSIGNIIDTDADMLKYWQNYYRRVPDLTSAFDAGTANNSQKFGFVNVVDFAAFDTRQYRMSLLNTPELTFLQLRVDFGTLSDVQDTAVLANLRGTLTVYAREYTDVATKSTPPKPVTMVSMIESSASVSNTKFALDLKRGYVLRNIGICSFTRTAHTRTMSDAIINRVRVLVDREIKYDQSWQDLQAQNAIDGQQAGFINGFGFVNFLAPTGEVDQLLRTGDYTDVSLEYDIVGTPNGYIRTYPIEFIPANK